MRISVKGRYALAAVIEIARNANSGENMAVINIAQTLGISRIYLEQVFTSLKKEGLLLSVKGSRGGYQLSRIPRKITVWQVLSALESALVEVTESTVEENAPEIDMAIKTQVFQPLDVVIKEFLSNITIEDLLDYSEKEKTEQAFMLNM